MAGVNVPTVEDRLLWARQNMALLARLSHAEAIAMGANMDTTRVTHDSSWCLLRIIEDTQDHIRACEAALGDAIAVAAPEVQ